MSNNRRALLERKLTRPPNPKSALVKHTKRSRKPRGRPPREDEDLTIEECFAPQEKPRKKGLRSSALNRLNEEARQQLLSSISGDDVSDRGGKTRGTLVPRWLLRLIKNSTEAIVLAQLIYWLKNGNKPQPKRGLNLEWVAKNTPDLAKELCRKEHEVNRALASLKKLGFVTWKTKKFAGTNCRYISIDWRCIRDAYAKQRE